MTDDDDCQHIDLLQKIEKKCRLHNITIFYARLFAGGYVIPRTFLWYFPRLTVDLIITMNLWLRVLQSFFNRSLFPVATHRVKLAPIMYINNNAQ
jgi:hypothetical protein